MENKTAEETLKRSIDHIFESGVNEIRVFDLCKLHASIQCAEIKTQLAEKQREVDALRAVIKHDERIYENESKECAEMKKRNEELEDMLRKVSDTLDANGNDYPMTNQMIKELIDPK